MRKLSKLLFMLLLMMSCSLQVDATSSGGEITTEETPPESITFKYSSAENKSEATDSNIMKSYGDVIQVGFISAGGDNIKIFNITDIKSYATAIKELDYTGGSEPGNNSQEPEPLYSSTNLNKISHDISSKVRIGRGVFTNESSKASLVDREYGLIYVVLSDGTLKFIDGSIGPVFDGKFPVTRVVKSVADNGEPTFVNVEKVVFDGSFICSGAVKRTNSGTWYTLSEYSQKNQNYLQSLENSYSSFDLPDCHFSFDDWFKENTTIKEFSASGLSDVVKSISLNHTFEKSTLRDIKLPKACVVSADYVYAGTDISSLKNLCIHVGMESLEDGQAIVAPGASLVGAFMDCTSLSGEIAVGESGGISAGCNLTNTFKGCTKLTNVSMIVPRRCAFSGTFEGCSGLKFVNVRYFEREFNDYSSGAASQLLNQYPYIERLLQENRYYHEQPSGVATFNGVTSLTDLRIMGPYVPNMYPLFNSLKVGTLTIQDYHAILAHLQNSRPLQGITEIGLLDVIAASTPQDIIKYFVEVEGVQGYKTNGVLAPMMIRCNANTALPIIGDADNYFWMSEQGSIVYGGTTVTTAGLYSLIRYKYPIEYELNGGIDNGLETQYNMQVGLKDPGSPSKAGYTFTGWYNDEELKEQFEGIPERHSGTVKLYASWKPNTYNIYYRLNDGINHEDNITQYTVGDTFTFKEPTKPHSEFLGWYTDSTYSTSITEILETTVGDKELVAKWEDVAYKITYELNGGVNNSKNPVVYYYGRGADFLEPTKENCIFDGWYLDAEFTKRVTGRDVTDFGSVTVYAKWSPIVCNITYELDGGTNNVSNPTSFILGSDKIILQNPTRRNCSFLGWFSDIELTQPITEIDTSVAGDITVYAKWYDYVGQDETAETYAASAPTKPVIKKLKNTSKGKLKISFLGDGTRYQIKISTNKKFKAENTKTYSTGKKNFTIKKLVKGKKYYVKIRAFHTINEKNVYSKWSKVKSVKIKK